MKKSQSFEDLLIWKSSMELTVYIYKLFQSNKDFGIKDQIQRASVSIMNNIAEGYERETDKEFIRFLFIAKGSCGEVTSMIILCRQLDYIEPFKSHELISKYKKLSSGIYKLIQYLRSKNKD